MEHLLYFFLGVIISVIILLPKVRKVNKINQDIEQKNDKIRNDLLVLSNEKVILETNIENLTQQKNFLSDTIQKQKESNQEYLESQKQLIDLQIQDKREQSEAYFFTQEEEYKQTYLTVLKEYVNAFKQQQVAQQEKINQLNQEEEILNIVIGKLRSAASAAVEANKRNLAEQQQQDYYRLQLSDNDIIEIHKLREIIPYLKDKESLNKVIYKVYYEKPYTDLVGRVVGQNKKSGIYKITNITNGMCYVGQAVDIAERWKQHIRRGVGADSPTNNKLYPIMYKIGPENFTFEIIEECDRSLLSEREDYWQDFFHAKDFGYSIK